MAKSDDKSKDVSLKSIFLESLVYMIFSAIFGVIIPALIGSTIERWGIPIDIFVIIMLASLLVILFLMRGRRPFRRSRSK